MLVLGIEHRPTVIAAAIREGTFAPRLLDDGQRTLIPNVTSGSDWGSIAASDIRSGWNGTTRVPTADKLWNDLHRRMVRYLGGYEPGSREITTVAASATDSPSAIIVAGSLLKVDQVISFSEAAIASWLSRQLTSDSQLRRVGVLTIGDTSAEAATVDVRVGPRPLLVEARGTSSCEGVGASFVTKQILDEIGGHASEGSQLTTPVAMWQSAMEMGDRLRRAPGNRSVAWTGPLQERLVAPMEITKEDFYAWPAVIRLHHWLHGSVRTMFLNYRPEVVIVSGQGASWPIAPDVFSGLPNPAIPTDPSTDLAVGASYWPTLHAASRQLSSRMKSASSSNLATSFVADRDIVAASNWFSDSHPPTPHEPPQSSLNLPPGIGPGDLARLLNEELDDFPPENL